MCNRISYIKLNQGNSCDHVRKTNGLPSYLSSCCVPESWITSPHCENVGSWHSCQSLTLCTDDAHWGRGTANSVRPRLIPYQINKYPTGYFYLHCLTSVTHSKPPYRLTTNTYSVHWIIRSGASRACTLLTSLMSSFSPSLIFNSCQTTLCISAKIADTMISITLSLAIFGLCFSQGFARSLWRRGGHAGELAHNSNRMVVSGLTVG